MDIIPKAEIVRRSEISAQELADNLLDVGSMTKSYGTAKKQQRPKSAIQASMMKAINQRIRKSYDCCHQTELKKPKALKFEVLDMNKAYTAKRQESIKQLP